MVIISGYESKKELLSEVINHGFLNLSGKGLPSMRSELCFAGITRTVLYFIYMGWELLS